MYSARVPETLEFAAGPKIGWGIFLLHHLDNFEVNVLVNKRLHSQGDLHLWYLAQDRSAYNAGQGVNYHEVNSSGCASCFWTLQNQGEVNSSHQDWREYSGIQKCYQR